MKTSLLSIPTAISVLLIALMLVPTLGGISKIQNSANGSIPIAPNGGGATDPMTFNVTLHGRGATFPAPFLASATSTYHSQNPNVNVLYNVNVPATGSGAGQNAFINKTDDFDASDAPLSVAQRYLTPNVLHIPETIGSVTLSYNIPNAPQGLNLTGAIIAKIYLGNITLWNDPAIQSINPGFNLPNQNIVTVHRFDSSGTTFVFTSFLSADSPKWNQSLGAHTSIAWPGSQNGNPPPIAQFGTGNPGVASVIASTLYSIGYVELNYAIQNNFHYAQIQNPMGTYVLPTLQTTTYAVQNSTTILPAGIADWSKVSMINRGGTLTYPIASFTYFLVYRELNVLPSMDTNETFQATGLKNFLYWLVNNGGQSLASPLSYVPLPTFVRVIDNASIASITFTTPATNTRTIHLSESATGGWNASTTNPNPTITIYSGDTVNLILSSTDSANHQWFVDYNNNAALDPNEAATASAVFNSPTPTPSPAIVPAIGISVPAAGIYVYRDANNPSNSGTIIVIQQQVAAPFPVPSALTKGLLLDSSEVTAVGSMVVNMRTLTASGNITEVAVDSTSGTVTYNKANLVNNLQLHAVPGTTGTQVGFLINAQVAPYALSTVLQLQLTGTTPTVTRFLTRELDIGNEGFVSINDISIVFGDYGFCTGNASYNPLANLTGTGCVNANDAGIAKNNYAAPVFR